jgi:hypothetical protein
MKRFPECTHMGAGSLAEVRLRPVHDHPISPSVKFCEIGLCSATDRGELPCFEGTARTTLEENNAVIVAGLPAGHPMDQVALVGQQEGEMGLARIAPQLKSGEAQAKE